MKIQPEFSFMMLYIKQMFSSSPLLTYNTDDIENYVVNILMITFVDPTYFILDLTISRQLFPFIGSFK